MKVKNLAWNENQNKRCNHPLLPKGIRGLIIGKSGCGKNTLQTNLLLRPGWLDYNNIKFFVKVCYNQGVISSRKLLKKSYPRK